MTSIFVSGSESEPASDVMSESETEANPAPAVKRLQQELNREKHKNSQLQAQIKRQTKLQGQLVR